jgi:SAM-dependent methyltransferase
VALKRLAKKLFPGVGWQHPVVNIAFRGIDPVDYLVRRFQGLNGLPPYSIRVRSNGVNRQFGGRYFRYNGQLLCRMLQQHAGLTERSSVLEIGCGCGRTAFALADVLQDGGYVGMDIERVVLESCRTNRRLAEKHFRFDFLDVQNSEYNPDGRHPASSYVFPYPDATYDVVFLVSVFTHMMSADVRAYISEIARMLRPGGTCMLTTFLMDRGPHAAEWAFLYERDEAHYYNEAMPEVAVGYFLEFFQRRFAARGMLPASEPLYGSWRREPVSGSISGFPQDLLVFRKPWASH